MYVTAQVISVHVCVQPPLHLMRFNKFCFMVSSIFVFQDYSLKSLHIITTNQAVSEMNRAVTKQLNGNQTQTKSMNVGQ